MNQKYNYIGKLTVCVNILKNTLTKLLGHIRFTRKITLNVPTIHSNVTEVHKFLIGLLSVLLKQYLYVPSFLVFLDALLNLPGPDWRLLLMLFIM